MSRRIMRVGKEGVATGAGSVGHCGLVSFRPGFVGVVFGERIRYRFRGLLDWDGAVSSSCRLRGRGTSPRLGGLRCAKHRLAQVAAVSIVALTRVRSLGFAPPARPKVRPSRDVSRG